ncbi:branched-chain amino acid ABC transporter permease [Chloroflexales bacterium ZM16-3]|nr:branched-chain amino acid ABC transporter permease [Chloroflexales bacterium ZM16-3]
MTNFLKQNRPLIIGTLIAVAAMGWALSQYEPRVAASILLSGLTLGALYFLVTSGLSLIFGLMDVLNFAHGLLFMVGAYMGYTLYANPRILLNTLPLVLAVVGGAILARRAAPMLPRIPGGQAARWGLWALAVALLLLGTWGFDLAPLASTGISAGGDVPTAEAQEALGLFAGRLLALAASGLAGGFALAQGQPFVGRSRGPRGLLLGAGLLALALLIAPARIVGEGAILGLSSNLRFVIALVVGAGSGAALGGLIEWSLIRPLYSRPIYQVLVTLGLVLVGTELVKGVWGPTGYYMDTPDFFSQRGDACPSPNLVAWLGDHCASIDVLGRPFPSYRIFIIVLGLIMFAAIAVLLRRSRLGMIIRAGVQDAEMVQALGINVRWVFTLVFALGAGLAALGGVAAAPFIGVNPGIGQEFQLQAFIAVVIGGMGSYGGAAAGALLVGLARAFGDQIVLSGIQLPFMAEAVKFSPSIARASTVLIMALVLLIRPTGLFGKKD